MIVRTLDLIPTLCILFSLLIKTVPRLFLNILPQAFGFLPDGSGARREGTTGRTQALLRCSSHPNRRIGTLGDI
jgi:hypothetical protein